MAHEVPLAVTTPQKQSRPLAADSALHIAWLIWLILLAVPFVVFIVTIWSQMDSEDSAGNKTLARSWFLVSMIYMMVGVPAAFFWRGRIFHGYLAGKLVAPRDYLLGMCTIWGAIEVGGLIALLGCIVTGTLLPNLLPALLAFMLFTPLWPNGHSMTRPLYNEHDPADYEDPR
ncbi:MAG TPA: hypothetical protein VH518_04325 [Tepidisphaeraceae bacterium]|jgi:hypothetical protein